MSNIKMDPETNLVEGCGLDSLCSGEDPVFSSYERSNEPLKFVKVSEFLY
jgi:hypothetical protein